MASEARNHWYGVTTYSVLRKSCGLKRRTRAFEWDGRTDAGEVAPESSSYQPEIELAIARRTILMPNRIAVDTTPPTVVSASAGDGVLISGANHTIALDYVLGGRARAAVYVRGRRVILGRSKQPRGQVNWNGTRHGRSLPAGRYVLEVGAVDIAGNEASPAERKRVVVRITPIALGEGTIRVAPGVRFTTTVRTAAKTYRWRIAGKRGTETKKRLRLRAPAKPGRYRLVVSEHHHSASALVIVGRR